jgi:phosphonate degradation associated HDIG domain protein
MTLTIDRIVNLFQTRGSDRYGTEPVNQLEHALQCATFAADAGEPADMVTACLLHDMGHLLHGLDEEYFEHGIDDLHERIALPYLRALFPSSVLEPIRLHVEAKRYLCATEAGYWLGLSAASKRSLELQGGVFAPTEAERFIAQPFATQAVKLRRWDDIAKVAGKRTASLSYFIPRLRDCCTMASSMQGASAA